MHSYRPAPVLEALGVCSEDEQLYRALLARPESTTTDLARDTGWPATRVGRHLRSLLSLGLVARTPVRPARYVPAVPEAAVELLALRKQAAIIEARLGASVLTPSFASAVPSALLGSIPKALQNVALALMTTNRSSSTSNGAWDD